MSFNWSDNETKALLFIWADEEIGQQLLQQQTVTYNIIASILQEQGISVWLITS